MLKQIRSVIRRAIQTTGYTVVRLPPARPAAILSAKGTPLVGAVPQTAIRFRDQVADAKPMSHGERYAEIDALLARVVPWSGQVPEGYAVDFLGILTDGSFLWHQTGPFGGQHVNTALPTLATYGEAWFEVADWFYSARDAGGQYVAVSLGAAFGAQLVGAWKVLQAINPMPARLVAVEPVPENCEWTRRHMAINGIDPEQQWIIQAALGVDNEPILFPVGAPGTGLTASVQTNSEYARHGYAEIFQRRGLSDRVVENMFLYNSTGITHDLGLGYSAEVKFVSAVTLRDVLAPYDRIDLLEVDIQQAEAHVIAPFMEVVNRKVRRVHIGSHGREVHVALRLLFSAAGWEIVFDYAPDSRHVTERGALELGDGILTARNPAV
jgi:FkbM family methyltransferase